MRKFNLARRRKMPRRRLGAEQIVTKLRQIEVMQGQGKSIASACKEAGTTEQSYYRYRFAISSIAIRSGSANKLSKAIAAAPFDASCKVISRIMVRGHGHCPILANEVSSISTMRIGRFGLHGSGSSRL
jgi:hypothetical protein